MEQAGERTRRDEDVRARNHDAVVAYVRSGAHGGASRGLLGVEVEHFPLFDDGTPLSYLPRDGRIGVVDLLEALSARYPERGLTPAGDLVELSGPEGTITLEPAAQVEMSLAPHCGIDSIERDYRAFLEAADGFLAEHGAHLVSLGYHPTRRAFDMPLIPKDRYRLMDEYFVRHVRQHGERMMRGSASEQVSVDYADEADCVRKMRVGSALAPVLAAICDNTPVFEAEPNATPIRRLDMWRHVSPANCGVVPGVFDEGFGFDAYADWVLGTVPIFVTRPEVRPVFDRAAAEAYADAPMGEADVAHLLSMFWPDARLKRVIEIRPADCLPPDCVAGYAALVKGLLYDEESRREVEGMVGVEGGAWPIREDDVEAARVDVERRGFDGLVYGIPLLDWEDELFSLARAALPDGEAARLDALEAFANEKPWWKPEGARA